jgi:hypothetical protein
MAVASSRKPCESFKSPVGARHAATLDGGGSQPEERHGLAAAVLRITRRRKNPVRFFWGKTSFEDRRLDPYVLPTRLDRYWKQTEQGHGT